MNKKRNLRNIFRIDAEKYDLDQLRHILYNGGDVSNLDSKIYNYIIEKDDFKLFKALHERGLEFNNDNVMHANYSNQIKYLEYILDTGINIDLIQDSMVKHAVWTNDSDALNLLIKNGFTTEKDKESALIDAVGYKHTDIIDVLLDKGIDLNLRNGAAIRHVFGLSAGKPEMVKYLVDNGAVIEPFIKDALNHAIISGNVDMLRFFIEEYPKELPSKEDLLLRIIIDENPTSLLDALLDKDTDAFRQNGMLFTIAGLKPHIPYLEKLDKWVEDVEEVALAIFRYRYGEDYSIKDLRAEISDSKLNTNGLFLAAKAGIFSEVLEKFKKESEQLLLSDLSVFNKNDTNLVGIMAVRQELSIIFSPEIWKNRKNSMQKAWNFVPNEFRKDFAFEESYLNVYKNMIKRNSKKIKKITFKK